MPSSSEAVAISTRSSPRLRRCSASRRCSLREAAVMRGDRILAEPFGEMARGALGHAPRIDENQRRAMLRDEFGEAVVDALPRPRSTLPLRAAPAESRARDRARGHDRRRRSHSPRRSLSRCAAHQETCHRSSIGFCVADRPMRTGALGRTARRAVRDSARDGAALAAGNAREFHRRSRCASSPACGGPSRNRAARRATLASSRGYAARACAARCVPAAWCRRCARRCGFPAAAGRVAPVPRAMPASGSCRFRRISLDSAFSGET